MYSLFDIDVFATLCVNGTRFVYLCCEDSEPDEVEFGVITKSTMTKFEITWVVVKSNSGCLGLAWRDTHTHYDLPTGRWKVVHGTVKTDEDCGLKWLYSPVR